MCKCVCMSVYECVSMCVSMSVCEYVCACTCVCLCVCKLEQPQVLSSETLSTSFGAGFLFSVSHQLAQTDWPVSPRIPPALPTLLSGAGISSVQHCGQHCFVGSGISLRSSCLQGMFFTDHSGLNFCNKSSG